MSENQAARPQDEHLVESPNESPTVNVLQSEIETLESILRKPHSEASYSDDSACQRIVEMVAQLGSTPLVAEAATTVFEQMPYERLGHYELLTKLGEGGMGAVYKARHTKLNKLVALKVLPADRLEDSTAVTRFEREMRAVGQLNHPNLVAAHDAGEIDGCHYLVMELVDGVDLSTLIRRCGTLPPPEACEVICRAAEGLQHAHDSGMVHRDIKPGNLMLTVKGQVKVLDMGLALLDEMKNPLKGELTTTGQMMGTLDYMAPEQGADSHQVDIRADVYSLGATLFKLLTGEVPFHGPKYETPLSKMMAVATETPRALNDVREGMPTGLSQIVARMLAKNPDERPATPQELIELLKPFADGGQLAEVARVAREKVETESDAPSGDTFAHLRSSFTDTHPSIERAPQPAARGIFPPRNSRRWWIAAAALIPIMFAAVLLSIRTPYGTIVVEVPDGQENNVEISVRQGGKEVELLDADHGWAIQIKEGKYELDVKKGGDRFEIKDNQLTVTRNEKMRVKIILRPNASGDDVKTATDALVQPYVGKGWVRLVNRMSDHCIGVSNASVAERASLHQYEPKPGALDQHWRIEPSDTGHYRLRNRKSGLYVTLKQPKKGEGFLQRKLQADSDEFRFDILDIDKRYVAIKSRESGLAMSIWGASMDEGQWIIQWPFTQSSTDKYWQIVPVPAGEGYTDWIDLLAIVDPAKHPVKGQWKRHGDELRIDHAEGQSRITLPKQVTGSYRMRVEFTRTAGDSDINVIFPIGDRSSKLLMSGWWGGWNGLHLVDGHEAKDEKNPTRSRANFINGRRYVVDLAVDITGKNATVLVDLNGEPMIRFSGDKTRLAIDKSWALPDPSTPGLGAQCSITFHSAKLALVSGEETKIMIASEKFGGRGDAGLPISEEGLVLRMTFEPETLIDKGEYIEVRDVSGNGHHGKVPKSTVSVPAKVGQGLKNTIVTVPDHPDLRGGPSAQISAACWFRNKEYHVGGHVMSKSKNRSRKDWCLEYFKGSLHFYSETTNQDFRWGNIPVKNDTWHHIAFVLNQKDSVLRLYLDGKLIQEHTKLKHVSSETNEPCLFGGWWATKNPDHIIDELVFFKRCLSTEEIKALYDYGIQGGGKKEQATVVKLTELKPLTARAGFRGYHATTDGKGPMIRPDVEVAQEYLFAHAPSRISYAVPKGMKSFTAVGYAQRYWTVKFKVMAGDATLYESAGLWGTIRVDLPPDTDVIDLILVWNHPKDRGSAFWIAPRFHPVPAEDATNLFSKDGDHVSLTGLKRLLAFKKDGELLVNRPPENLAPPVVLNNFERCKEYIYANPESRAEYKIPVGATAFSAVGYSNNGGVQYKVYADKALIYSSPKAGIVPIKVGIPKGASILALEITGWNFRSDSHWCYPRFHISGSKAARSASVSTDAKKFGGHWYKVFAKSKMRREKAAAFCQQQGGHLARIESQEEYDFIRSLGLTADYWIDGSEGEKAGQWVYGDGSTISFLPWMKGSPTTSAEEEHIELDAESNHAFKDSRGAIDKYFICEWSPNYALKFDGKDDHVVTPIRFDGSPYTIEAYATVDRYQDGMTIAGSMHQRVGTALEWSGGKWRLTQRFGPKLEHATADDDVPVGKRTHFAAVWDGKQCRLFIDGVPQTNVISPQEPAGSRFKLLLGADYAEGDADAENFFAGSLDEIRISDKARYNDQFIPAARFESDENTLALYHCDEGSGALLRDSSGNNRHGKIVGAKWVPVEGVLGPLARHEIAVRLLGLGGRITINQAGKDVTISNPDQLPADLQKIVGVRFVNNQRVDDDVLEQICEFDELVNLNLYRTSITDRGVVHIQRLTSLRTLDLTGSSIGDASMPIISQLSKLRFLSLRETSVSDAGLKEIENLDGLQTLNLYNTRVSDGGLKSIGQLTNLQTLGLHGDAITDAGIGSLSPLKNLRELDLYRTRLTDAAILVLEKMTSLQELGIDSTQISAVGVERLRKALPGCAIHSKNTTTVGDKKPASPFPATGSVEEKKAWVVAELKRLNPDFDGKANLRFQTKEDKVTGVDITDARFLTDISPLASLDDLQSLRCIRTGVSDLLPLRKLRLTHLDLEASPVADLRPISQMPLESLVLRETQVRDLKWIASLPLHNLNIMALKLSDLSALKGMQLTSLNCSHNPINDLSTLSGMPLTELWIGNTRVEDLKPLREMKLTYLEVHETPVSELSPLEGMPLQSLQIQRTKVRGISVLAGMPLRNLHVEGTKVTDLSPLKTTKLEFLRYDLNLNRDAKLLQQIKTLKTINGKPAAEVLGPATSSTSSTKPFPAKGTIEEKQTWVIAELKRLNPEYNGNAEFQVKEGRIVGLNLDPPDRPLPVKDISPLAQLQHLRVLDLHKSNVTDVSPLAKLPLVALKLDRSPIGSLASLKDLPLEHLSLCDCTKQIEDWSPLAGLKLKTFRVAAQGKLVDLRFLKGMPLENLWLAATGVSDLSPVKDAPIRELNIRLTKIKDLSPLRDMPLEVLQVDTTQVADLSPLAGLPLKRIRFGKTNVTDVSPLLTCPLIEITCDISKIKNLKVLDTVKSLQTINGQSVSEVLGKAASAAEIVVEKSSQ